MGYLASIFLIGVYFSFAYQPFVNALRTFYDNHVHGMLLASMLVIPYLLVSLPAAANDPNSFLRGFLVMLVYILVPVAMMVFKPRTKKALDANDIIAILILWLFIEFDWLPEADAVLAPGISIPIPLLTAIALGFLLFLILRPIEMGYSFRLGWRDAGYALQGWAGFFVIGLPLGLAMGFIQFGAVSFDLGSWLTRFVMIYFLNALPEEMLFRGVIQNLIEKRFGSGWQTLLVAALIFGMSHINNTTAHHMPPNWPYVLMATFAGIAYGWSWRKSGKITGSALTHTLVNFVWSVVFSG